MTGSRPPAAWPRPPALVADLVPPLLLAALLLAITPAEARTFSHAQPLGPVPLLEIAASALALGLRRRHAVFAYSASVVFAALYLVTGHPPGPIFIAPFLGLVGVIARTRPAVWAGAAAGGAGVLALAHGAGSGWTYPVAIFAGAWLLAAVGVAGGLRARRRYLGEVQARVRMTERSREEEARRRMAEERLQIAREMHDVVGHSLAVITLQAGVAEHLLETRPHEARRAISAIRDVSKVALGELRTELAVLRGTASSNGERTPTPGLRDLPDLVARMRAAGLDIALENDADVGRVPDIVASAMYRIAQESLTNVVRHAGPGARASVRTHRTDACIEVEVIDTGTGARDGAEGDGINGMRERVTALGGDFSAGSRPGGGFRVWASLPWPPG